MIRLRFGSQRLFSLYLKEDEKPVKNQSRITREPWKENIFGGKIIRWRDSVSTKGQRPGITQILRRGQWKLEEIISVQTEAVELEKIFFYKQSIAQSSLYDGSPLYLFL
jgi:hypothetical protein